MAKQAEIAASDLDGPTWISSGKQGEVPSSATRFIPTDQSPQPLKPMRTVQSAVETFNARAKEGRVANLKSGFFGPIPDRDVHSILSCAVAAFTHAAGRCDLSQIPYDAYADELDRYARLDAEERGLSDAAGRAARCRRFVATVDGIVRRRRRSGREGVPVGWRPLYDAAVGAGLEKSRISSLARLAAILAARGIRTPEGTPNRNRLIRVLRDVEQLPTSTVHHMLFAYRHARTALCEIDPAAQVADIDRCPTQSERGLRSLPDIVERLEAIGHKGSVVDTPVEDFLRILAPTWCDVVEAYLQKTTTAANRANRKKKIIGASSRFLAALASTGHGELGSAHPTEVFLRVIDTGKVVDDEKIGGDEWQREFLASLGIEDDDTSGGTSTLAVRLFQLLAYEMAHESAMNSPRSAIPDLDQDASEEPPFWTHTVIDDTRIVGELALFAGERSRLFRKAPQLREQGHAEWRAFLKAMSDANKDVRFAGVKAKERALNLVTYPMVICLGLPALRRRVHHLRGRWQESLLRHSGNGSHPRVVQAENALDEALHDYIVMAVFTADGLRLANYANARLGPVGRAAMVEQHVADGEIIRSYCHIEPVVSDDGASLRAVRTNFYGDDHPAVKLKIDKVPGSDEWREHPHRLRPGIVDMDLFLDYLVRTRPRRLAAQGLIADRATYSLARDVSEHHFALFVSPDVSQDPYKQATGAYSDNTISERYGRVLRWICTHVLGRDLPPFGPELKREYPKVFCAHIARLLAGSYIFGVRDRKQVAATFLNDTARMVERRYSVTEMSMMDKQGWEAPDFFDAYFDRIWNHDEVIDWEQEYSRMPSLPRGLQKGLLSAA